MPPGLFLLLVIALVATILLWRAFRQVTILYAPNVGLLYRDGRFVRELAPGRYVRFDPLKRTKVVNLSVAETPVQLGEITVLSKDQFSFRITLAPILRIVDARAFVESQPAAEDQFPFLPRLASHAALQPLLASAAMDVASSKTLSEILADERQLASDIRERLADAIPGASVEQVLLTGINLPPETRKMFTDVERAKLEAQAGLERARGESASLRVLANAARLLKDNPSLANLRLLQAAENSKGNMTIIVGDPSATAGFAKSGQALP